MNRVRSILIAGAGEAGRMIAREYRTHHPSISIIGFLDDDLNKKGQQIEEFIVLGPTSELVSTLQSTVVDQLIIAMPSASPNVIRTIVSTAMEYDSKLAIHIVPGIERYFDNVPLIPSLSDITFSDLFQREEVEIDIETIKDHFTDKTVCITGAGGSIGSEMCRQLLKFPIKKLVAIGKGEHSIYLLSRHIDEYLTDLDQRPEIVYHIGDVRDSSSVSRIFIKEMPDIVFHAAAHKHVPLMEHNEIEAVKNNLGGTLSVLESCKKNRVSAFILISTDKAVAPTNIMGATKRLAELVTDYFGKAGELKTSIVRFGNVVGSRGSVVPLFIEQIRKGGPVSITHDDVTRYFMTIPEAAILVINAAAMSEGQDLYVLDMGKPQKIRDLAESLIKLHGLIPGKNIPVQVTGLRDGEKLHEELFYDSEEMTRTHNSRILRISGSGDQVGRDRAMTFIRDTMPELENLSSLEIRQAIKAVIPQYDYSLWMKRKKSK